MFDPKLEIGQIRVYLSRRQRNRRRRRHHRNRRHDRRYRVAAFHRGDSSGRYRSRDRKQPVHSRDSRAVSERLGRA